MGWILSNWGFFNRGRIKNKALRNHKRQLDDIAEKYIFTFYFQE